MDSRKTIKYKLCHCDIIGKTIEDIIPAPLFDKYEFVQSKHPDYVFYSVTDRPEVFTNYPDAIKIFISGEPVSPSFTFFDYCIGMDDITFGDRYFYYPDFIRTCLQNGLSIQRISLEDRNPLASKTDFMNYIQSHDRPDKARVKWVKVFDAYKPVNCPGPHLHNCEDDVSDYTKKITFQSKHKFSLIVEASDHPHFITEKIIHALIANTVPVYYGTKDIDTVINPRCFISLIGKAEQEALELIRQIDLDDKAYLAMLQAPIFVDPNFVEDRIAGYEAFLDNIFSQEKANAFRRERWYYEKRIRKSLKRATLVLPTKDRLSSFKSMLNKK